MTNMATIDLVNQFFSQLGIRAEHWPGNPISLSFEQLGTLHIEQREQGLSLALANEINQYELPHIAAKALRLVHVDQQLPFPIIVGLHGSNTLTFVVTLRTQEQTIANLNQALERLDYLHDQLRS